MKSIRRHDRQFFFGMRPSRGTVRAGSSGLLGLSFVAVFLAAASGGVWWWMRGDGKTVDRNLILHTVERGDFQLNVTERGEVEAFDVTEIRSLVKSNNTTGNAILRIVPEGTVVKQGDFLVELDSSAMVASRTSQKILVNSAKAAEIEAQNTHDTAVIAKREYLEGTNKQERQTIESEVFVAEENLNRAKEYFAYSQKLASKGYVNELQLEADRFAVEKAKKDLDTAKTKLHVLEEFTKPKMLSTLESAILIAKAKWDSGQNSHELELEKLKEFDDQIAKCTITAPQDGVVKYAHVMDGRGDQEFVVEEGTIVRERQAIIRLPNADSMRVNLQVNESLIQYIKPGMPAVISPVGFGDRVLHGKVEKVNQYAEPTGWRQANVKEYKAFVSIDTPAPDLRSGMTASVTIQCAEVPDALQVPVQAVYAHGNKFYCFLHDAGKWEAREIVPGPTNDKFYVIESGLEPGERVSMNPRAFLAQVDLPKLAPELAQRAIRQSPTDQLKAGPPGGQPAAPQQAEDTERKPGESAEPQAAAVPGEGSSRMKSAVRVVDLRKDYVLSGETIHALRGVTFDVPVGDYISIMGPSGSGKSTMLNLLGCLDRPSSGQFMLSDVDVSKMSDDDLATIRATRIGFIFQSYNLLSALTVEENIEVPLYYSNRINSASRRRCRELADLVGLSQRLNHRPTQLSGGQQQRVAIARSLVNDPEFILADEPTGNLDSVTTGEILDLLERLNAEGRTIIMVTHEPDVAARTKRSIVLEDGQVVSDEQHEMGTPHSDIYKLV